MSIFADPRTTTSPVNAGVASRAFRRLSLAWAVSLSGDGVRAIALPLYVAVQAGTPFAAAAVVGAEVVPWLLVAIPAGAVVDRVSARTALLAAHGVRAVCTGAVVVAMVTGNASVPVLCFFAAALTSAETFAYSASQALLVKLAGPEDLDRANAKFYAIQAVCVNVVGPLAAGAVFVVSPAVAFALDGLTFLIAAVFVAGLPALLPADNAGPRSFLLDIREGVQILATTPGLRTLVGMVSIAAATLMVPNTLMSLYAVEVLRFRAMEVAATVVVSAAGTLLAAWLAPRLRRQWSDGPAMIVGIGLLAIGMVLMGVLPSRVTFWGGAGVLGTGIGLWNVLAAARRQRLTPAGAVGRISGAYRLAAWGMLPAGAVAAGAVASATSMATTFILAGLTTLAALAAFAVPLLRTSSA